MSPTATNEQEQEQEQTEGGKDAKINSKKAQSLASFVGKYNNHKICGNNHHWPVLV